MRTPVTGFSPPIPKSPTGSSALFLFMALAMILFSVTPALAQGTSPPANTAPTAVDDTYSVSEDRAVTFAAPGVLGNDTDPDTGDTLTATLVDEPTKGTLTLNADGSFNYEPDANANGTDTFTYQANDGTADSNIATVTINVAAVNDAPTISDVADQSTDEDTATGPIPFTVGDQETAPENLTVTATSDNQTLVPDGNITVEGTGADRTVSVAPAANESGSATITLKVNDGTDTATDTFVLTVASANDAPVAQDDTGTTQEDTPVDVDVLKNDSDQEKDLLTVDSVTQPTSGTAEIVNGQVRYTPNTGFTGEDTFTYTVSDGDGGTDTATVTVTVNSVNDKPTIRDNSYTIDEDKRLIRDKPGVLNNDDDVERGRLEVTRVVSRPAHGQVNVNPNGSFNYAPDRNYNGKDTFTYRACDSGTTQRCASGVVNITIRAVRN